MLELIRNFSVGLDDVTIYNFRTTERILRYLKRIKSDDNFKKSLSYIGVLFHAMEHLNYRVRLIPNWNEIT